MGGIFIGLLVVLGLGVFGAMLLQAIDVSHLPIPTGPAEMVLGLPIWLQMLIALSAGFTEEVLFRGYAIERTTELTRSRWLGAILPMIVFGAAHIPFWGVVHGLLAGLIGVWLTLLYLWRRDLWTNITAHALWDALILLAADYAAKS
jgi:membrane protease YdiL (CAAX protease family)